MRTIKDSLELIEQTRVDCISALREAEVTVESDDTKLSEIPPLIRLIEVGGKFYVQVTAQYYPDGTTFTLIHTDQTKRTGNLRNNQVLIEINKAGKWTITDSFSEFTGSVTINDTTSYSCKLPRVIVTTDVSDGQTITIKKDNITYNETVVGSRATFVLPSYGKWTLSARECDDQSINVTEQKDYTIEFKLPVRTANLKIEELKKANKYQNIIFTDRKPPNDSFDDLSVEGNRTVAGWNDNDTYYISSQQSGIKITAPLDCSNAFYCFRNLVNVDLQNLDTSSVINMAGMFAGCEKLEQIEWGDFNTTNVTDMSNMFSSCYQITSLNLKSFRTSRVRDMSNMFSSCSILEDIELRSFNTSQVTTMRNMFSACQSLVNLNVSNFITRNVINFNSMFSGCRKLNELNVSNFDTSKATDMSRMFNRCELLKELDLRNFKTDSVNKMEGMFYGCESLTSLNISNFNTSNVTDMSAMFSDCILLETLNLSHFNTTKVTGMHGMFQYCKKLITLNLSNFDTSSIKPSSGSFYGISSMFNECYELKTIYAKDWTRNSAVVDSEEVFFACSHLVGDIRHDQNKISGAYCTPNGGYFTAPK